MDIKDIISNNSADGILSDKRILNILTDLGYFKEHPNHRLILRSLIEYNFLCKLIDVSISETSKAQLFNEFISNTGFDIRLTASIFSSISGITYSNFDDRITWSPSLSKEDMEKYILQHLSYFFDKRIVVKDVSCIVRTIDRFVIVLEFQKSSWDFDYYENLNAKFFKSGKINRCKSTEVILEIWSRSGNNICADTSENTAKVSFEWDNPIEYIETESGTECFLSDSLTLSIDIRHPVYDISWIQVRYFC